MTQEIRQPEVSKGNTSRTNWQIYAAASGAAFAMSTHASAAIIYSGATTTTLTINQASSVGSQQAANIFVGTHGAFFQPNLANRPLMMSISSSGSVFNIPRQGYALLGASGLHLAVMNASGIKKFAQGAPIDCAAPCVGLGALRSHNGSVVGGAWGPGTVSGFVGFRSTATGDLGWILIKVLDRNADGYPDQLQVLGFAFNDAGGPIAAGQTTDATPEPGTMALSLLATGAAGLLSFRKRRKELGV